MKNIKKILLTLFILLLIPSFGSAFVDFTYPSIMYLSPYENSFTLYVRTNYQIDVDTSLYTWKSTNTEIATVSQNGIIRGKYNGKCRIIGTPIKDGLERINIELNFPSFIYGGDYVEIDSSEGAFHEYKLQGIGISGMDFKVSGGVFECQMASNMSGNGPDAMYLTPIKPGKGTLTYIYNSKRKINVTVVVKESAFYTPSPEPTSIIAPISTPVPSKIPPKTESDALPDPKDYSGSALQKVYSSYDYNTAKNTPETYKGTSVYASGRVFLKKILDDGWGYALFFESKSGKSVYITLPPGSLPDEGIEIGDNIEVYGVAQTLTETTPSYPIILTTMKIVNHRK